MNFDTGVPTQHRDTKDIWRLPKVLEVSFHPRHFDPPRRVTTSGVDRQVRDGVEVEIKVSEPFPIRALGPVLWVGDEPLTIAEGAGKNVYRFLSFEPNALKANAPISLGWNSRGSARKDTGFRYSSPAK
jgi:hypothetical protein